ncbi:MAG: hypothetical protein VCA57_17390 [Pseudomonas sp.]|uniref:hypothetical protein n=1 Tax=Pseudomonas sp. TaxID=306 RepID=UPI003981CF79
MERLDPQAMLVAVQTYFKGERLEMFSIVLIGALLLIACTVLYLGTRDGFSRGFCMTVALAVALFGGTALWLLCHDPQVASALLSAVHSAQAQQAFAAELSRMQVVIDQYPLYRLAGIAFTVLAVVIVAFVRSPLWNGVAAGFCLMFVALLLIDHYSAQRAHTYMRQLSAFVEP